MGGRGASSGRRSAAGRTVSAGGGRATRSAFTSSFGSHDIDIPGLGGGHIDEITGPNAEFGLTSSSSKAYEAYSWDARYNMGGTRVFTTLNAAKDFIINDINKKR